MGLPQTPGKVCQCLKPHAIWQQHWQHSRMAWVLHLMSGEGTWSTAPDSQYGSRSFSFLHDP